MDSGPGTSANGFNGLGPSGCGDESRLLLLDGGFSNVLNKYCSFNVHHEGLWTAKALIDEQDAIKVAHLEYLEAGCDIIETSSYQASLAGFSECLNIDKVEGEKLLRASVRLAKEALNVYIEKRKPLKPPLIAGSVGPYGAYLRDGSEYTGKYAADVTDEQLLEFHVPRLRCLIEEGVDLIAIETNPSLREVRAVMEWLKHNYPAVPVWASFSLRINDEIRNPLESACGDSLKTAFTTLAENYPEQLWGFGINCVSPEDITPFLKEIHTLKNSLQTPKKPKLIVYPNCGQKWTSGAGWAHDSIPPVKSYVKEWIELGANIIGGCCQVGPDEIKEIRLILDEWNQKFQN